MTFFTIIIYYELSLLIEGLLSGVNFACQQLFIFGSLTHNREIQMKRLMSIVFAVGVSASFASAAFFSTTDGFESDTAGSAPSSSRGWSSANVAVSNTNPYAGSNAAYLNSSAGLTNSISESSPTKAWTDFRIRPALGVEPLSAPTNTSSAIFFFDGDGYINVWNSDSNDWVVCSNDVWGASVTPVTGSSYSWVSIYQNFSDHKMALFLNDKLVIQDVPFVHSQSSYSQFVVQNVDSNAYLDNVWIKSTYEPNHTLDSNGRAGVDVVEVDTHGYAGRTLYVNGGTGETPNYSTIGAAVAAARDNDIIDVASGNYSSETLTISPASTLTSLIFTGSAFTVSSLTINSGVTVTFNFDITAGTITASDNITLAGGANLTANTKLDLQGSATLTAASAGSAITIANLDMASGTTISVTGGTLNENTATLAMDGSFTINGSDWNTWGGSTIVAQSLPYSDGFESYVADAKISDYGLYGWGADSDSVKVQTSIHNNGSKALILPDGTSASNTISTSETAIWTVYYLRPALGAEPASSDTTGKSFMSYVDTNGFMEVYTGGAWVKCDSNLANATPDAMSSNSFKRIAIYQNFSSSQFALFVANSSGNLELVKQKAAFPGTQTSLSHFIIQNRDNTAYLDDISISTTTPSGGTDLDGDGMLDTEEINLNGSTLVYPDGLGTIFRFS